MNTLLEEKVRKLDKFVGYGGIPRQRYEFTAPTNLVAAHSCLMPSFSLTLRVGDLRKLIELLNDDDLLTATVEDQKLTKFTFVR